MIFYCKMTACAYSNHLIQIDVIDLCTGFNKYNQISLLKLYIEDILSKIYNK